MSASFPDPTKVVLTITLQDIGVVTPANKVRTLDVRFANVGGEDAFGDLVITNGTTVINRAKNYPVPYKQVGSAPDMESKIIVPAGWKLQGKASAGLMVEASILNIVEVDIADFS